MASAPEEPARTRVSRRQFSLRALLLGVAVFALAALGGKWLHEAWLRREVQTLVTLPFASVNVFAPHIDMIVRDSPTIAALQVDSRSNSLILTAQYRNLEAARAELLWLTEHPAVLEAARVLGLPLPEAIELCATDEVSEP